MLIISSKVSFTRKRNDFYPLLNLLFVLLSVSLVLSLAGRSAFSQESQPSASAVTPDPWPKIIDEADTKYTIYQPRCNLQSYDRGIGQGRYGDLR
jgi:hypothetical protein